MVIMQHIINDGLITNLLPHDIKSLMEHVDDI